MLAAAEAARAAGVTVVAIGQESSAAFEIAVRTGGATALVQDPVRFPIVFHALNSSIGHALPLTRVRIELDAGQPGVLVPGRTVSAT